MSSKWQWLLSRLNRTLWVRAALFAVVAVGAALLAVVAENWLPVSFPLAVSADGVDRILDILASSMLAVTTFSLSVMVAAHSAATSNVSPRATLLLREDATTRNVLATFIGSFLFALVSIVALSLGSYGERGRLVLFLVTLGVIALIVITILRWIEHLTRLGRVGETTDRVEHAIRAAMAVRTRHACLGGVPAPDEDPPPGAVPVHQARVGYVRHLDVSALAACADALDSDIRVAAAPGAFVHPARPLAWILAGADSDARERVAAAFTIGDARSFDQDPRFGLAVLAEIASRALSPAVNDPGTAIDIIGRAVRILCLWRDCGERAEEASHPRVQVPAIPLEDLFDDIFLPIERDGAALFEVQVRLLKALEALALNGGDDFAANARHHAGLALERAERALLLEEEKAPLRALLARISRVPEAGAPRGTTPGI